jgi:hypothetical protein
MLSAFLPSSAIRRSPPGDASRFVRAAARCSSHESFAFILFPLARGHVHDIGQNGRNFSIVVENEWRMP